MNAGANTSEAGSYAFDGFTEDELTRLNNQAEATWKFEHDYLVWSGINKGDKVLDVGCGSGIISRYLSNTVGPEGKVVGIDINETLINKAKSLDINNGSFFKMSGYSISGFDEYFDFAYVRLVLQHAENPLKMISEIKKKLKPGGKICILDSDESTLHVDPEPHGFQDILLETQKLQSHLGGNRKIGRLLEKYLKQDGFIDLEAKIFLITPQTAGIDYFLDTILSWRPQLYPENQRPCASSKIENMKNFLRENIMIGYNGSFVVKGKKAE